MVVAFLLLASYFDPGAHALHDGNEGGHGTEAKLIYTGIRVRDVKQSSSTKSWGLTTPV
jgi:hypothetical protein